MLTTQVHIRSAYMLLADKLVANEANVLSIVSTHALYMRTRVPIQSIHILRGESFFFFFDFAFVYLR